MEFDLDSNGGLMNQILALTAPPGSRDRSDSASGTTSSTAEPVSSLSAHPYFKRPGRGHNRDCCDACGEGGDLICCDICPASFHLICHDPPLYEEDIPMGEWGCFQCQVTSMDEDRGSGANRNGIANFKLNRGIKRKERDDASSKNVGKGELCHKNSKRDKCDSVTTCAEGSTSSPLGGVVSRVLVNGHEMLVSDSPFRVLVRQVATSNPKQFVLPYKHTVPIAFPGESKSIFRHNGRRGAPFKKKSTNENGVSLPAKLCFTCKKGYRAGSLLCCDYCPLMFHLDCLDPPLTIAPTHRWMCPNHPEQFLDEHRLTSCRVSERVKLWDKCRGLVDQVAVQRSFFNLVHRKRPPSRYKIKRALRKAIRVPEAIKDAYRNPVPLLPALPPAHLRPPPLPSTLPLQYVASHLYERLKPDVSATALKTRESSRESSPSDVHLPSTASCSVAASSVLAKEDSSKDASNSISVSNSANTACQSEHDGNNFTEVPNEVVSSSSSPVSVDGCTKVCPPGESDCRDSKTPKTSIITTVSAHKESNDKMDEDVDADTTLDSSSQLSEDMESQKEISTEEEGEDSHDSEFHVGRDSTRLRSAARDVSEEESDSENFTSSDKGKSLKSIRRDEIVKSIEPCLLKECDDKVIVENKFKRIKIDESIQGLIQSNGDINDRWNSLIDEQFENNNKIVPKRKGDCKINNSSNKVVFKGTENCDKEVDAFTRSQNLPLETYLRGGEEMEVVSDVPAASVQSSESDNKLGSFGDSPIPIKSSYISTTDSINSKVTDRSVSVCRGSKDVKLTACSKSVTTTTTLSSCETKVTAARLDSSAVLDGLRVSSHSVAPSEKRSSDAVMKHSALTSAALASPNPDWPSPIMDISDDSSTSERPLLVDCLDESNKQRYEGECNSSSPSKIFPNSKNCFGPNKSHYNNHIVTSQFSNTFNTYSKSYQVLNSYPSKLSSSGSSRDLALEPNNFINSRVCPAMATTVAVNSLTALTPNCQGLQSSEHVKVPAARTFHPSMAPHLLADVEATSSVDGQTVPEMLVLTHKKPTKEEIDVWLTGLVSFQSSVAKMMMLKGASSGPTTSSCAVTTTRTSAPIASSISCCCSSNPLSNSSEAQSVKTSTTSLSSIAVAPSVLTQTSSCVSTQSVSLSAPSEAAATGAPPCLPKPSSAAHPTTLPSTPRAGRKQVLIPRTSPTGSSSSSPPFFLPSSAGTAHLNKPSFPASGSTARTPAKTYIARVSSSVSSTSAPESRALCLSDLLHETLQALQTKLHAAHAAKHSELSSLDRNLLELLAMQRLEQLQQAPTAPQLPPLYVAPALPAHALLCPLIEPPSVQPVWVDLQPPPADTAPPVPMQYRLLTIGKGSHNNVNLERYGHCNYVSSNHACIVLDEYSGHYELVNYSSDGSIVDGGVYRCDLSGQKSVTSQPPSSSLQQQVRECIEKYRQAYNKNGAHGYRFNLLEDEDSQAPSSGPSVGARSLKRDVQSVMTSRSDQVIRRCGCARASVEDRVRGGWEGPAVLRHGSFIKFGCLKFVFSIVETASTGNWRAVTEEAYTKFYERECRERREEEAAAAAAAVKNKEKETSRGSGKYGKEKNKDKDKDVIFDGGKEGAHKETLEKERKKESKKSKREKESKKDRENKSRS
ncbi:PHD finger protein 12 MRG binding domain [Trinorchestia longiramus]|nr:PHD finger protein 12 MRG binding domain [Trinorchestia longiramus]